MRFESGNAFAKGRGRPRGSKNKRGTVAERATQFLLGNFNDLQKEYDKMPPSLKIKVFEILMAYAAPRLTAMAVQSTYERLPDDDLEFLAESLKQKVVEHKPIIKIEANGKQEKMGTDKAPPGG